MLSWWRGTVVERQSLAGELSLSCARPCPGRGLGMSLVTVVWYFRLLNVTYLLSCASPEALSFCIARVLKNNKNNIS